jgi:predicted flap endonuclease-1-like 5' DNA nuclease
VKGIGPAYADRLAAAGVETIADLGDADAADLAERTSLSEKRISRWVERARTRLD